MFINGFTKAKTAKAKTAYNGCCIVLQKPEILSKDLVEFYKNKNELINELYNFRKNILDSFPEFDEEKEYKEAEEDLMQTTLGNDDSQREFIGVLLEPNFEEASSKATAILKEFPGRIHSQLGCS